jgi:hypothetical protein
VIFDVASTADYFDYHYAANFKREYDSLFGLPLMRDMERLQGFARKASAW